MSLIKRIKGDYEIKSLSNEADPNNIVPFDMLIDTGTLTVNGDLIVTGTTTSVESEETFITDNVLTLNSGETQLGISSVPPISGLDIDRGLAPTVTLRFNEEINNGLWEATDDGTDWYPLNPSYIDAFELIQDPTPQLGGDLVVNYVTDLYELTTFKITSVGTEPGGKSADVIIDADDNGQIKIDHVLSLEYQAVHPTVADPDYNLLYAGEVQSGGTGLYVKNEAVDDELVSRKKAIVFGLIF